MHFPGEARQRGPEPAGSEALQHNQNARAGARARVGPRKVSGYNLLKHDLPSVEVLLIC